MNKSNEISPAIVRLTLCLSIGGALGLTYDNLSVGFSAGIIFGLFTPAKYFDAYLLGPDRSFLVSRVAIAAGAIGFVNCISIFTVTCVTGFTAGFLHGLFS